MRAKSATKSISILLLLMSLLMANPQAGIAAYRQVQPGVEFAELVLPSLSLAGPATAGGTQLAAQVGPAACTVPTTATVRGKSVQFDQCYEKAFSHGGTNYAVQVFYTEANSTTNLNQCTAGENAANRCEHALANNDDANGDNVNAVAMADEAERAVRFYHDRNLNLLSGTTAQVYIAEDPRLGGVIWPNSIYIDDDAIDNNDTLQKRLLAFHEMQHLVQDKYDGLTGWQDFFGEGIARTIEDRVDTTLDADTGHLFIPEADGILGSDTQRASDLSTINYRSVLWWVWLMDQYRLGSEVEPVQGWPAIRDFYTELSTESDQVKALYDFVASKSSSFRKDFIDYTLALYAYRFNPTDPRLGFLDNEIRTATTGLRNHTVITTGPAFSTVSQAMNPRSSRYWEFTPANQCAYVAFSFDGNGKNYGFSVMTVDGGNLQKRWTSYGTGWSRTVRSADLDRVVGVVTAVDDSGTVDIGRGCIQPTVNIKDPTSAAFAMVGQADNPRQFITRLDVRGADNSAVSGLLAGDFTVQIRKAGGGSLIDATVVNAAYVQDNYWLVVQAPSDANGAQSGAFYDLIVTLGTSSDTESSALLYVERTQDVLIVLDRSGSMGGSTGKIEAARNAANLLVNELSTNDQGGFVAFDGDAYLREGLDPVTVGHRNDLFTAISLETPGGVTSIGDGMLTAATEEDSDGIPANLCSFVLLSDGHENEAQFWADVRASVIDNGCSIHSIALGPGTNEPLMQQIAASVPGGSYDYATTSGGVPTSGGTVSPLGFLGWENNLSRVYDYKAAQVAGRQRLNSSNGGPADSACVDFEDLKPGARYVVGSLFADSGANILGKTYYWGNGTPYNGGYTEVGTSGLAGGSGNELQVNNINLAFDFGGPVAGLTLNAFYGGGNMNIEVNGDFVNFGRIDEIDGAEIGGARVSVVPIPGTRAVRLTLVGTINSFSIGGQELWIDDVCPQGPEGLQFYVDDASDKLVVAIAWQMDSKGTQAIQLYDPDGNPVSQSRRRLSPTGTNEVWEVPGPKEGFWKLVVQKLDQEYMVSATARTQYEMYLFVGTPVGSLSQGVRVPLLVTFVGRGKPLLGATVVATVRAPNGTNHALQLLDDGNHGDGEANDGIYGATYRVTNLAEEAAEKPIEGEEPQVSGSYLVTAVGTKGNLRREAQGSFAIQPGRDGDRDRIPDRWEVENGLDPENGQDSGTDFDRDKLTAWCEYQLGTDPRNSDTDGGGELDGSETRGLCVATTQDPLDPSDDRVGPLSSIAVHPEATFRDRFWVRLVLGQPLRGRFLSADIYRRTYSPEGRLLEDWQFLGTARQPEVLDGNVEDGLGYAYMAIPTIALEVGPLAPLQEGEATGRVLESGIVYASPDPYPPTGSILINNGDAETNSLLVTLSLSVDDTVSGHDGSAEDPVPGSPPEQIEMRLSNTGEFGGVQWQPFRPLVENWSLEPVRSGQVAKVYVQFRDAQGNVSETGLGQVDTILYRSGLIYLPMVRRP